MQPGDISGVVELEWGHIVLKMVDLQEPDQAQYAIDRESIYRNLYQARINAVWTRWVADLKARSDIIDNRASFY
jgi:hypothetical protein